MKITIIGAGHMGGALAVGIARAGRGDALTVTAAHTTSLEKFAAMGIRGTTDNLEAVADADIVFIAVKPWVVPAVLDQISPALPAGATVVSVCPGVKPEVFREKLRPGTDLIYVIPNTAIEICESMSFIIPAGASQASVKAVSEALEGTGVNMVTEIDKLPAVTALASCGIAYAFEYVCAAARGGAQMGIDADEATMIVAQTLRGAALLLQDHGPHPKEEIDKVTTPGGLTLKGLKAMEEAGFSEAVIKGLMAGR